MSRNQLIQNIEEAFKSVKLEDGIGLWEAQGHDDRLTDEACLKLRAKDEKENWHNIPVLNLYKCNSSLSFFDAKGMRFHLPVFLLFALNVYEEKEDKNITKHLFEPDIEFHLTAMLPYLNSNSEKDKIMLAYDEERFSLLNVPQIGCVLEFLKYRMQEIEMNYKSNYATQFGTNPSAAEYDIDYIQFKKAYAYWELKSIEVKSKIG